MQREAGDTFTMKYVGEKQEQWTSPESCHRNTWGQNEPGLSKQISPIFEWQSWHLVPVGAPHGMTDHTQVQKACLQQAQPLTLFPFCDGQFTDEETSPELSSDLTSSKGPELTFPHWGSIPQLIGGGLGKHRLRPESPPPDGEEDGNPVTWRTEQPASPAASIQETVFWTT